MSRWFCQWSFCRKGFCGRGALSYTIKFSNWCSRTRINNIVINSIIRFKTIPGIIVTSSTFLRFHISKPDAADKLVLTSLWIIRTITHVKIELVVELIWLALFVFMKWVFQCVILNEIETILDLLPNSVEYIWETVISCAKQIYNYRIVITFKLAYSSKLITGLIKRNASPFCMLHYRSDGNRPWNSTLKKVKYFFGISVILCDVLALKRLF